MIIIIGGASRTGKGILSRRLLEEYKQPYLSLDVLKMGIVNGLPSFGLDPEASAIAVAEQLWPLVRAMTVNMVETGVHYIIEGEILPTHADELAKRYPGEIHSCFLGYADISPRQKLAEIRQFAGHLNDWMSGYEDEESLQFIEESIAFSQYLREECTRLSLPYFDVSQDFTAVHDRILTHLKGG